MTLAYVLRAALEGWEPYIWVVSDTRHQANLHLENIKAELTENRRIADRYDLHQARWPAWRAAVVELPNRVRIEALGVGQRLRGKRFRASRPTLIVCDDLQNDSHMVSAFQRAHGPTAGFKDRFSRPARLKPKSSIWLRPSTATPWPWNWIGRRAGLAHFPLHRALARRHDALAPVASDLCQHGRSSSARSTLASSTSGSRPQWMPGPNCCGPRKKAYTP